MGLNSGLHRTQDSRLWQKWLTVSFVSLGAMLIAGVGWGQGLPPQAKPGATVCVAQAANVSSAAIVEPHITSRLIQEMKRLKLNIVEMESQTPSRPRLEPDRATGGESKDKDCDYTLLTQIVDSHLGGLDRTSPQFGTGRRIPSNDASEDVSPPLLQDINVRFALFRSGRLEPILQDETVEQSSTSTTENLHRELDREAYRIAHELKKQ